MSFNMSYGFVFLFQIDQLKIRKTSFYISSRPGLSVFFWYNLKNKLRTRKPEKYFFIIIDLRVKTQSKLFIITSSWDL